MSRQSKKRGSTLKHSLIAKCDEDRGTLFPHIEKLSDKSLKEREGAAQSLCGTLVHHFVPNLVEENRYALKNFIENSIKRGKASEQLLGAKLAALLALQLGPLEQSIFDPINQLMLSAIKDQSLQTEVLGKICAAFGLFNFFGCDDVTHVTVMMNTLKDNLGFKSSRSGKEENQKSLNSKLDAEILSAWTLLLTSIPLGERVSSRITLPFVRKVLSCLESPQLELRVAASEALCIIWESGRLENVDYLDRISDDFINAVPKLATDSSRFRGKRELKFQRATFRDVLSFLEEDILPEITVRFDSEVAVLDSWARYVQYSALCMIVGPGMTNHLETNNFAREVFQLNSKLIKRVEVENKTPKLVILTPNTVMDIANIENNCSIDKAMNHRKLMGHLSEVKLSVLLELLTDNNEINVKKLYNVFTTKMYTWNDPSGVRVKCCIAMGLLSLSAHYDQDEIIEAIMKINRIFEGAYMLGRYQSADSEFLYSASLFIWGLLITLLSPDKFVSFMLIYQRKNHLKLSGKYLVRLLKCSFLEVRLTAAETVTLILEWGRVHDRSFLSEYVDDFTIAIRQLNKDLQNAKHSIHPSSIRKFHRATCDDILNYIETNISPDIKIPTDNGLIVLNSWRLYFRYSAKCVEIGSEMVAFLLEQSLIPKKILQQIATSLQGIKQTKLELDLINTKSSKKRSLSRNDNRNKRLIAFT